MGQDQSALGQPSTLRERSIQSVAEYIKSGSCKRVVVMTGAGISTASGIPDFRSPSGLYANLDRLNLPTPESVFEMDFFRKTPGPFYELAKELYPGQFCPTVSHMFIALLARKGFLSQLFTQNIDCLERRAGVPDNLIVEAHGSFATSSCIGCKAPFPNADMRRHVFRGEVPHCPLCSGLVKPDIVFFGEALPPLFQTRAQHARAADLALVMGTSLTVYPFAGLPEEVPEKTPRVLFNMQRVGRLGSRADDVLVLEDCDSGIRKLADALGWREELESEWRHLVGAEEAERQLGRGVVGSDDATNQQDSLGPTLAEPGKGLADQDVHHLVTEMAGTLHIQDQDLDAHAKQKDAPKKAPELLNANQQSAAKDRPTSQGEAGDIAVDDDDHKAAVNHVRGAEQLPGRELGAPKRSQKSTLTAVGREIEQAATSEDAASGLDEPQNHDFLLGGGKGRSETATGAASQP